MSDIVKTAVLLVNGTVQDAIVGDAAWAREALGGDWRDTTGLTVGRGYTLVGDEWRYPSPFPSWVWEDGAWVAPVPEPKPVDGFFWAWDEDAGDWQQVPLPERP